MRSRKKRTQNKTVKTVKHTPPPKPQVKLNKGMPFRAKGESVFMGCPKCPEWIDVTKVFTDQYFDGVYECSKGHSIIFGGITVEKPSQEW